MPLLVNLRHLEAGDVRLEGTLPVGDLDIDTRDEVIQVRQPLHHHLEVQKLEDGLLVQGRLHLILDCLCVRCLKRFQYRLKLDQWTRHLPLQGDDAVAVVNDCVDLTPCIREDILLEFPRHPLCDPECRGLPKTSVGKVTNTSRTSSSEAGSSPWVELDKLKL
jgi:uncharacterized metal-binding protein YceD (DUF177 family)